METSVRLLRLLGLLQSRPHWTGAELAGRLEVTARTVRSDVERLRTLGYQVDSASGTAGGYRLGAGSALPPLLLDDEEAVAVAVSLHAAAGGTVSGIEETSLRALTKLERMLPSRLARRIGAVRSATVAVAGRGPTVDAATLTAISAAVRDHEGLRFDYKDHEGTARARRAEPHRLVFTGRRWYLVAWDNDRDGWRTFRADRIELRTPNGPRFTPRELPGGDAAAHVLRGTTAGAWRHRATIRVHAPVETVRERLDPEGAQPVADGDETVLETGADSLPYIAGFLARLDLPFTVVDPPELRDLLAVLATRFHSAATDP